MGRCEDSVPTGAPRGPRAADGAGERAGHLGGAPQHRPWAASSPRLLLALHADIWAALNFRQPLMLQAIGGSRADQSGRRPGAPAGRRTRRPTDGSVRPGRLKTRTSLAAGKTLGSRQKPRPYRLRETREERRLLWWSFIFTASTPAPRFRKSSTLRVQGKTAKPSH